MAAIWRLVDTGLSSPAGNIALNRGLLEARRADEIPSTLHFGRSTRAVLLGHTESAEQLVDIAYCHANDIPIQRRITNGAASYIDERQLLCELYIHRRDVSSPALGALTKRICHAAATALNSFGIDACYRGRNEIEVDGRTIATAARAVDGTAILVEVTLTISLDVANTVNALRFPGEKLGTRASDATCERIAGLKEILGREPDSRIVKHNLAEAFESEFDVEFREGDLGLSEHARYEAALRQIDTIDWISLVARPRSAMPMLEGVHDCAGGQLRAILAYDAPAQTIRQVWFSGDITIPRRRPMLDLEAALRDTPLTRLTHRLQSFFASQRAGMEMLGANDILTILRRSIQQPLVARDS